MKYFFLISFIIASSFICAQHLSFGPKIGVNIGAPLPIGNIPKGAKGTPLACHNLGLFFSYSITNCLSVQTEILLLRKGAQFITPIDSMPYKQKMQHPLAPDKWLEIETFFNGVAKGAFDNYYIEIPFMIIYKIGNSKWEIAAGAYYDWLDHTQSYTIAKGRAGYDPTEMETPLDFAKHTRNYDFGPIIGASYNASDRIGINFRISYGLKNVFEDDYKEIPYPVHNLFTEFSASYSFSPSNFFSKK